MSNELTPHLIVLQLQYEIHPKNERNEYENPLEEDKGKKLILIECENKAICKQKIADLIEELKKCQKTL